MFKGGCRVSSGTFLWYRSSYGTDFDNPQTACLWTLTDGGSLNVVLFQLIFPRTHRLNVDMDIDMDLDVDVDINLDRHVHIDTDVDVDIQL